MAYPPRSATRFSDGLSAPAGRLCPVGNGRCFLARKGHPFGEPFTSHHGQG